jgi:MarR family transcriptional regulator for hemolysin
MALQRQSSVGYMTNMAGRLLVRALERRLAPLGLSPAHMPVLLGLEAGPQPQKVVATRANVEQPTMTATLNHMERDGLVERVPNPDDGRSSLVALTALARENLPAVEAAAEEVNALALDGLEAAEREQYFTLLARVISALEADSDRAPSHPD